MGNREDREKQPPHVFLCLASRSRFFALLDMKLHSSGCGSNRAWFQRDIRKGISNVGMSERSSDSGDLSPSSSFFFRREVIS